MSQTRRAKPQIATIKRINLSKFLHLDTLSNEQATEGGQLWSATVPRYPSELTATAIDCYRFQLDSQQKVYSSQGNYERLIHTRRSSLRIPQWTASMQR